MDCGHALLLAPPLSLLHQNRMKYICLWMSIINFCINNEECIFWCNKTARKDANYFLLRLMLNCIERVW